jgi:hypothetical protein
VRILIVPNLLIHYIKFDKDYRKKQEQEIEYDLCGFKMDKYTGGCQFKCFRSGLEISVSE